MINDFFYVLYWWALLFGLGLAFLPLTSFFFHRFFDRGYALAKILGLLVVTYFVWLLGSLKILPFSPQVIWFVIFAAMGANFFLWKKRPAKLKKAIKKNWRIFLFEEILFLVALMAWSFVRGFQPSIQGLEKFMDYGFINSLLRTKYFPPADMWLAGETINYYYFGHLTTAVLTKLSGIDSAITYNLMVATLFGLCLTAGFCLGSNLMFETTRKKGKLKIAIFAGLLTAFLLTLGGNLHPLYWFATQGNFQNYWYPDATRFIVEKFGAADNTIHEFPLYSFVVADLHGHLLNLPAVILFLALILVVFRQKKFSLPLGIFISWLLSIFYMTNTWDFLIYSLVLGAALLFFNYLKHGFKPKTLFQAVGWGVACLFGALLFSLPYQLHFQQITQGPAITDFHSPLWMLPVLWGLPLFSSLVFLNLFLREKKLAASDYFFFILLAVSWFLILIPEFIYLQDIYIHSHQRANTMFKLTYQAFVMFSFLTGYVVFKTLTSFKQKSARVVFLTGYLVLLASVLIYPYFATRSYYGLKNYQGLYGLNYLKTSYPRDYEAILWLKKSVADQPVIVEAVGESYTNFARVSANTGLPTVLGWRVHEWLWRGSFDEPGKRTEEVKTIYESPNLEATKELLNKHQVTLIFLGTLERKQYPQLQEEKFAQLGEVIFSSGRTKIYQLRN